MADPRRIDANIDHVWLATNGSITNTALALAKMAQKGVIDCDLSQDSFHDPIDPKVLQAFTRKTKSSCSDSFYFSPSSDDQRAIRNVEGREICTGRCDWGVIDCVCEDMIIMPDGTIKACGCDDAPTFGTVFEPRIPDEWCFGQCCHCEDNKEYTLSIKEEVCA